LPSTNLGGQMQATGLNFDLLEGVQPGDEIDVQFTPHAYEDFIYLRAMDRSGVLNLGPGPLSLMEVIKDESDWRNDRSMTLTVGPNWHRQTFEGRMRRCLETLDVRKK
jgi:hypothetical protein